MFSEGALNRSITESGEALCGLTSHRVEVASLLVQSLRPTSLPNRLCIAGCGGGVTRQPSPGQARGHYLYSPPYKLCGYQWLCGHQNFIRFLTGISQKDSGPCQVKEREIRSWHVASTAPTNTLKSPSFNSQEYRSTVIIQRH